MNLLTLQLCKEGAEQMVKDPCSWIGNYRIGPDAELRIIEQGRRTLEVIAAYNHKRAKG